MQVIQARNRHGLRGIPDQSRLLDQFPTLDPQLNEETAGSHVLRQIMEGLMIQDDKGDLRPGVATGEPGSAVLSLRERAASASALESSIDTSCSKKVWVARSTR